MVSLTSSCCLSGRIVLTVKLVMTSFSAFSRRYCCLGFSACSIQSQPAQLQLTSTLAKGVLHQETCLTCLNLSNLSEQKRGDWIKFWVCGRGKGLMTGECARGRARGKNKTAAVNRGRCRVMRCKTGQADWTSGA